MREPKLVVWDLDDTFWRGTLSEGGAEPIAEHLALVRALAARGILSSIASKNDRAAAEAQLQAWDIWSWFVLPVIAWQPKGEAVRWLIAQAKLRAEDVLFIDDEASNRAEVEHFNPGITCVAPQALASVDPERWGKDDAALSRLEQFRRLERRLDAAGPDGTDNQAFLRASGVRIRRGGRAACLANLDRLHELMQRTNRLNFTRVRLPKQALLALIADERCTPGLVWARDNWGDYGLVGFYAVVGGALSHFLFSCRVLDLGVERYMLDLIEAEHPGLRRDFDVEARTVDWIEPADDAATQVAPALSDMRVAIKGACDLDAFLPMFEARYQTTQELQIPLPSGLSDQFSPHTELALRGVWHEALAPLTFVGPQSFGSPMIAADWDVLVYGLSVDYWAGLYRHRAASTIVAAGWFFADLFADPSEAAFATWENDVGPPGYIEANRARMHAELEWLGGITTARIGENLDRLADIAGGHRPVILINVADTGDATCPDAARLNPLFRARNRAMNAAVDAAVARHANLALIDVRAIAGAGDIQDMHSHLARRCYVAIAQRLQSMLEQRDKQRRVLHAFRRLTVGGA